MEIKQDDKMRINLMIGDINYPINIDRKDEERYRKVASIIERRLNKYRASRPRESIINHLTMIAFQFVLNYLEIIDKNDTQPYKDKLTELTNEIEKRFQEEVS